jgi:hypothetical protein
MPTAWRSPPSKSSALSRIVYQLKPVNHTQPMIIAATPQAVIRPRYTLTPSAAQRVAIRPMPHENTAIARIVPTANATRYAIACALVGSASIGRIPKKCELPARPCNVPIANAA